VIPKTPSYTQLKKEYPTECASYERYGYANAKLLARASEIDPNLRDKLWIDSLKSKNAWIDNGASDINTVDSVTIIDEKVVKT